MKTSKTLGIVVAIVQLASLAAFGLSLHTLASVMTTTLSQQNMEMTIDEATRTGQLQLNIVAGNQGLLPADLTLEVSVIDPDGVRYASDSSEAHLESGAEEPLSLTLHIPSSEVEKMMTEGRGGDLEIVVTLRTLYNLAGFTNTLRVEGGEIG